MSFRTFCFGWLVSLLDFSNSNPGSDLARDPFCDHVPLPDEADDSELQQNVFLNLLFFQVFFFFWYHLRPWHRGRQWSQHYKIVRRSSDVALHRLHRNLAIEASTTGSVTTAFKIFDTTFTFVVICMMAASIDYQFLDSFSTIDNWRLLRTLQTTHLIHVILCLAPSVSNAPMNFLSEKLVRRSSRFYVSAWKSTSKKLKTFWREFQSLVGATDQSRELGRNWQRSFIALSFFRSSFNCSKTDLTFSTRLEGLIYLAAVWSASSFPWQLGLE